MNLYIDYGGTYLRYQIEENNSVVSKERDLGALIRLLINSYPKISDIFVAFAGQVEDNIILSAPNIDINGLDLKALFPDKNIVVENDLRCALLAESRAFEEKDLTALYVGTGIGSSSMSDGKVINGFSNFAGEIGHIPYKKAPFKCGCGKDNCLELFCSGSALSKWSKYLKKDFKTLKEAPKEVYDEFVEALMYASGILVTLLNPKVLVLGGGVIQNNPFLVDIVKKDLKKYAFNPSLKALKVLKTKLKDAPLKGCKILGEKK